MDLVERYLQAVKFWVPKHQKDDIIAELSDDLAAEAEEREARLGRQLTEAEVQEILKQRGRPVLVATRYLPRQSLIGPALFPIYRFVLKIVVVCCLVVWGLAPAVFAAIKPFVESAAAHTWNEAMRTIVGSCWTTLFLSVAIVTLVFAVLERAQEKSHFLEDWDPRKLPPVRNNRAISRASASFELAANLVALAWWGATMRSPVVLPQVDVRIDLAPVWEWFFWGFLFLIMVRTALASINLIKPYWTRTRMVVLLASDLAGSGLFCWLTKANVVVALAAGSSSYRDAVATATTVNGWLSALFPFALLIGAVTVVTDGYRLIRLMAGAPQPGSNGQGSSTVTVSA